MVSFSCNACQDTLKKPKLVQHFQRCRAPFTCLDCNKEMWDGEFQKHTTCISEAEKYEKSLYKGDKKKNKGQQQQQSKSNAATKQQEQPLSPAEPVKPAPVATPAATPATNGSNKPTPIDSQALAAQAAAAPSENAETPSSKKEKKRKRKSEVVKNGDIDAGNTSEAQVAKELIPEKTAESAAQVEKPVPKTDETEGVTGESGEKKKRKRQKKSKAGAETNGDVATMEVDKPAVTNGASSKEETLTQTETSTSTKIDLKETLASKIPEKGKSVSLAECFGDLPADQIKEALAGLRVQRGKKDRFELSIGYT